jgi:hypothetical protein
MAAKGQHTIPRLHLQHFAGASPVGQVWTYDSSSGRRWSAIPDETCKQTHFYSIERDDGTMDTQVEDFLSKVESRAAPVYQGLTAGKMPRTEEERGDFALFLGFLYCRTTAMRRISAQVHGHGAQILNFAYASNSEAFEALTRRAEAAKGAPIDPRVKEEIRQRMLKPGGYVMEVPQERTLGALKIATALTPIFQKMRWSLAEVQPGSAFITSDNPVAREVDPKTRHPIYGDGGFLNKTAEVTCPLSPTRCLILSWDQQAPEHGMFEADHVALVNAVRAVQAERYLFADKSDDEIARLAEQYKDTRPTVATEGFGPEQFVPIEVARRSKTDKR